MLQYLIKFSISLAVLFIFYRAVLRPLTFYQCNRFYLLGYSLLSFVIPFIDISSLLPGNSTPRVVNIIPAISYYNFDTAGESAAQLSLLQRLTLPDWLLLVFCIGAIAMLVRLLLQYFSLRGIRRSAVLLEADAGVQLYETSATVSPFSFGNAIYFNRQLHTEEELQRIIQHEFVHVKQKHTVDLLVGELLCVVNWFNPFAWLIRYSIRQNLEFIADNNVVANGLDKKEYQYLLLKVVGVPQYSIANNFNVSNLKKRIAMMNKMKTAKMHLTKFLFVLPLMVVLLLAFRKNDHTIAPPVAPATISTLIDTIPPPPPPVPVTPPLAKITMDMVPQTVNQQGYIISIADNHGECIVVIKDKTQKIVKAQSLVEWNKEKETNENQYGMIPSPPPPPLVKPDSPPTDQPLLPVKIDFAPADQPLLPVKLDFAPANPQAITDHLPADVSGIVTTSHIDKKTGIQTKTAAVTLKNGKKEIYHLNKADEKAKFIEKYGRQPQIHFDTVPAPPAVSKHLFDITDTTKKPLFIVDGIEQPQHFAVNSIDAAKISSVNVIKGQSAVAVYGEKAASGAVLIRMKKASDAVANTQQPSVLTFRKTDPNKVSIPAVMEELSLKTYQYKAQPAGTIEIKAKQDTGYFPKDVLVIIDGKEIPYGSKISDYVQTADIESITVVTDKTATDKYGDKGKNGVIEVVLKSNNPPGKKTSLQQPAAVFHTIGIDNMQADSVVTMRTGNKTDFIEMVFNLKTNSISYTPADALVLLDGKALPKYARICDYIARNDIREITASKDESDTNKYGSQATNGVIIIQSKEKEKRKI